MSFIFEAFQDMIQAFEQVSVDSVKLAEIAAFGAVVVVVSILGFAYWQTRQVLPYAAAAGNRILDVGGQAASYAATPQGMAVIGSVGAAAATGGLSAVPAGLLAANALRTA